MGEKSAGDGVSAEEVARYAIAEAFKAHIKALQPGEMRCEKTGKLIAKNLKPGKGRFRYRRNVMLALAEARKRIEEGGLHKE